MDPDHARPLKVKVMRFEVEDNSFGYDVYMTSHYNTEGLSDPNGVNASSFQTARFILRSGRSVSETALIRLVYSTRCVAMTALGLCSRRQRSIHVTFSESLTGCRRHSRKAYLSQTEHSTKLEQSMTC